MNGADAPSRISYIDGLRAVAVLSVVAFHTWSTSAPVLAQGFAASSIARIGNHGVDLFFVLSGFCLAHPTLAKLRATGTATFDIGRFAARRLVRILPPYYAAITLFVVIGFVVHSLGIAPPIYMLRSISVVDVLHAVLFLDGDGRFINASFWSLPVEFRWYFVFPIVLWLWTRSPRAFRLVFMLAVASYLTSALNTDLSYLPAFMLGIVAAEVSIRGHRLTRYALPAFIVIFLGCVASTPPGFRGGVPSPAWQIAAFLFVVAAGDISIIARVLSLRPLVLIGAASYSIYLVHAPIAALLERYGVNAPTSYVAVVAFGLAFWMIAERPFVETRLKTIAVEGLAFLGLWLNEMEVGTTLRLRGSTPLSALPEIEQTAASATR
ncbi:MAG: acyltransferase family protein [Thermoanaerobaculia bacterium]